MCVCVCVCEGERKGKKQTLRELEEDCPSLVSVGVCDPVGGCDNTDSIKLPSHAHNTENSS